MVSRWVTYAPRCSPGPRAFSAPGAPGQGMSSKTGSRLLTLQRHLDWPRASAMASQSSPLTTHVLDTASGIPARGLCLQLFRLEDRGQHWMELRKSYTDPDGRCPGLLTPGQMKPGIYKLFFDTENYWKEKGQESFYPYVEIVFTVAKETQKFHVPLLLSPWSYTTYRGS